MRLPTDFYDEEMTQLEESLANFFSLSEEEKRKSSESKDLGYSRARERANSSILR